MSAPSPATAAVPRTWSRAGVPGGRVFVSPPSFYFFFSFFFPPRAPAPSSPRASQPTAPARTSPPWGAVHRGRVKRPLANIWLANSGSCAPWRPMEEHTRQGRNGARKKYRAPLTALVCRGRRDLFFPHQPVWLPRCAGGCASPPWGAPRPRPLHRGELHEGGEGSQPDGLRPRVWTAPQGCGGERAGGGRGGAGEGKKAAKLRARRPPRRWQERQQGYKRMARQQIARCRAAQDA